MPILRFNQVSQAFGLAPVLDNVSFQIDNHARICLVGRNGEGKSSLFRLIAGETEPDDGVIELQDGIQVGYLPQEIPKGDNRTVYEFMIAGLGEIGELLKSYQQVSLIKSPTSKDLQRLSELQNKIEHHDGWRIHQKISSVLSQFHLVAESALSNLSGGWIRRAALARALIHSPELLLLDEPTNHLDLPMIQWLEEYLLKYQGTILFISHDRAFINRIANQIIELDRGQLTAFEGNYQTYLDKKAHQLEVEAKQRAEFDKKLSQEEAWIRQGIKARRTRNEGRVRALKKLREEYAKRRHQQGKAKFSIEQSERSGKLVAELTDVSFNYSDQVIIKNFSTTILRGERVGLIGPNGVGKSTLLNIITGQLAPSAGKVRRGTNLQIAYFEQVQHAIDETISVAEAVSGGQQMLSIGGKSKHIISYLKDFLFAPERAMSPIKVLSGGERNRLALAKLFLKPSNLIIMDEPTNDLDMETLELLEERLLEYPGTLLVVSHDRAFLDNVITNALIFEGNGIINEHVGSYSEWANRQIAASTVNRAQQNENNKQQSTTKPRKRTYKEQQELKLLPQQIETLEQELSELQTNINHPDFFQQPPKETQKVMKTLQDKEKALQKLYSRWEELEEG